MGPHNETVIGVRAPVAKRDAAHAALKAENWKLQEFISACIDALLADPARFLRTVARHRPTPKPKGRPRKNPVHRPAPHGHATGSPAAREHGPHT